MDGNREDLLKSYISSLQVSITLCGYTHVPPNWRGIDQIHEYNKFYLIQKGEGWVKIGGSEFYPKPGQLLLMPAGVKQSYAAISANTYVKYWCHFTAKVGNVSLFDLIKLPLVIETDGDPLPETVFRELIESDKRKDITAALVLRYSMLRLIAYYFRKSDVREIVFQKITANEKIGMILKYIDDNRGRNISIDELAGFAGLHPSYFIRLFKKNFGISPIQYINRKKIEDAKQLLRISDYTVSEISNEVGISDLYYFSRLFKEYTGFSPSAYRQLDLDGNSAPAKESKQIFRG